jgi:DNA ligase (NAD+)
MSTNLLKELTEASQAFYETGEDIMSDAVFDSKWSLLYSLDPSNKLFTEVSKGYKLKGIDEKEKMEHPIPVGSVDKVKDVSILKKWLHPKATFSTKIDGNSIVCYYKEGQLQEVVTRGSENIGIIRTAKFIKIIPATIPVKGLVAVRGEAAIKRKTYKMNSNFDQSKASRSAVAGAITRKDDWKVVFECVDFIAYTFVDVENGDDLYDKTDWTKLFKVEEQKPISIFHEMTLEDFKKTYKDEYEYDADGVVFKNPDGSMKAFKFEDEKAVTELLDILWSIGKDQRLTPVAQLREVQLSGAKISKASLGSFGKAVEVEAWPVFTIHKVELVRANEIIPHIEATVLKTGYVKSDLIPKCPVCGTEGTVDGEHIFCRNLKCENINSSRLLNFASFFFPEGMSDKNAEKMFDAYGISTVRQLLDFNSSLTKEVYGIGESQKALFKQFLDKTRQEIDVKVLYEVFINNCGSRAATKIVDSGFDIYQFIKNPLEIKKLYSISNFNSNIINLMVDARSFFEEVLEVRKISQVQSPKFFGTFCITGARFKADQLTAVNDSGWAEDSSIKKTTNILVTKDPNSTSAKIEKAKSFGIPVMTIDQFLEHISN